jgi:hypothetical protein
MQKLTQLQKLNSFHKIIQRNFGYHLKKYDYNSYKDFQLASNLIVENIQYSALQRYLPIHELDITNEKQVREFFENPDNFQKLKSAFAYIAQNNNKVDGIGYHKVYNDDFEFIGNAGFIIHKINEDNKVSYMERGIHIDTKTRNAKDGKSKKQGSQIMHLVIENLEDNLDKVDMNGTLLSSILKSNTRSQNFTLKHKLNVGNPTSEDDLTYKWEQPIKSFVSRISEIKESLEKDIRKM